MNWYQKYLTAASPKRKIPRKNRGGDCYEVAGKYVMDNAFSADRELLLVHGIPTGQGPIVGIPYGHAWVESIPKKDTNTQVPEEFKDHKDQERYRQYLRDKDIMVIDKSNGRSIEIPKVVYYAIGNIDESKTKKYTPDQMRNMVLKFGHWGPWELETEY